MHDIRAIRENSEAYAAALSRRPTVDGAAEITRVLELDAKVRTALLEKEQAEAARNAKSKEIGKAKAAKDEALAAQLMADVAAAKETIQSAGETEAEAQKARDDLLARLPNVPLEGVPQGTDEHGNVEQRRWGQPRQFDFTPRDHADIGESLGLMDFEAAARMSGARFVVLRGQLARLERALAAFMLDVQTSENGYSETSVPLLVRDHAMFGTGQLPKFGEDLFQTRHPVPIQVARQIKELEERHLAQRTAGENLARAGALTPSIFKALGDALLDAGDTHFVLSDSLIPEHFLIPTSEVSLTNTVREQILDGDTLPMRLTAATPCFRSEAGSAGRDTKGMIRQHQFIKVELVSITKPEDSDAELERMTICAEGILQALELPYRTMLLCTGDMGFGARRTYDLEVWLPSQDTYREISSCSTCGDFQARRMDAKFRREPGAKPEFVHTLNGSGLAVGRTLVAILENYQRADGKVDIPKALQPYMGGLDVIG